MPTDREIHDAAARRAASLHFLGPEEGAGARIWAQNVADELVRHDAARTQLEAGTADHRELDRFYGSSLMLVVAIDQVLTFETRVCKLTGDADLRRARQRFDAVAHRAEAIRDIAAHLDAYAVGDGNRQTGRGREQERPVTERNVRAQPVWTDDGRTFLQLADESMSLHEAATAAIELAEAIERARVRHLDRSSKEADAALRREYQSLGIDTDAE